MKIVYWRKIKNRRKKENNLIEYSKNYRKTSGSLWTYYRDELTVGTINIHFPNKNIINSESFKHKTSVTGSTYNVDIKITNAEGNEINNPAYVIIRYSPSKSCKKKLNCSSIKISE